MSAATVVVTGYYGFGNIGDEAILGALIGALRGLQPSTDFIVVSGDPDDTRSRHAVEAIPWSEPAAIADAVRRSDLVILGGGGLFQDYWGVRPDALLTPRHGGISFYAGPAVLAALARKPVVLYGLGFGPLESADARRFSRAVCEAASYISVRDESSKALLVATGIPGQEITVSADAAFLLDPVRVAPESVFADSGIEPRRPFVGVALRPWLVGVDPVVWEREVAETLDRFLESVEGTLLFVPFQRSRLEHEDDAALASRIVGRLGRSNRAAIVRGARSAAETAGLLAGCDLVLGMRLHSLLFAISAGVSPVAISYDPKVRALLERVGLADHVEPLVGLSGSRLLSRMQRALEERDAIAPRLREAAREQELLAAADIRRLSALVAQPPPAPALTQEVVGLFRDAVAANIAYSHELAASLETQRADDLVLRTRLGDVEQRLASTEAALAGERSSREALAGKLDESVRSHQRDLRMHRHERLLLEEQLGQARQEINDFKTSRLWKAGHVYWSARRAVAALTRPGRHLLRRLSGAPPSDWVGPNPALRDAASAGPLAAENLHDVVCFPIIEWDFRFQRPQQLMKQFARAGHRVFYVAHRFRSDGPPWEITPKLPNLYEVTLRAPAKNVYKERLGPADADALFEALDALRRDRSLGATVSIVQLPFWAPVARRLREERAWPLVYDLMDHHAGFSSNETEMLEEERGLLASADLVLAASAFLEEAARRHNERVLRLPNACDYEHFSSAAAPPRGTRPVVGYYGAISDWFDAGLVAELAGRRPDWDFVLVGSTWGADLGKLPKLPNVRLTGEKPYAEIPRWLEKFDVAIIPFRITPLTRATNPVKAYEILAAGKPLVSVPLPELEAMEPLVRTASSAAEFETAVEEALRDTGAESAARRREFAAANTWEERFGTMSRAVARAFPKLSIVVVTYNNRELNRLCLESIAARTEWPNLEVIVVDNASTDGTREVLEEAKRRDPALRLVLNETNRGFPAAANAGLEAATGEYLILLNNDTVVTRSWATALVRHLAADSGLGLVGPTTNAIANSARIEAGYSRLEDLPEWAAAWVRQHDGETFEIPMLAFFCVAIRREVVASVGLLDERFGVGMVEDDDYNRRVREAGFAIRCARDSFVHHWQMASFRALSREDYFALFEENKKKYREKWGTASDLPAPEPVDSPSPMRRAAHQAQFEAVLERVARSKGAVIFLPSVGWGIHLFQRPHHLARVFARLGYVAVFDSSNASYDNVDGFKEIEPNLYLFKGAEALLHEIPSPLLWAFTYNFHHADLYPRSALTVYDWIDDLDVFPHDRKLLDRNHERGLREATIVTSVARRLHERALAVRPDALYLPNGVEYERFASSPSRPDDEALSGFLPPGAPVAGYYGALAEWFDYPLLESVSRRKPEWRFVLIGPQYDASLPGQPVLKRPNVRWLGPRDYLTLPGYLGLFDVATIPFRINNITLATSPLKLYEYFAGGKPVVTTPMPECQAYPEVLVAETPEQFAASLERALERGRDPAFRARLRVLGRENSWEARVRAVLARLRDDSAKSVSREAEAAGAVSP